MANCTLRSAARWRVSVQAYSLIMEYGSSITERLAEKNPSMMGCGFFRVYHRPAFQKDSLFQVI